jgi:hypothetical protein
MSFIGQGLTGLSLYASVTGLVSGYTGYGEHGLTGFFYTEDGSDVGNTGLWRIKGSKVVSGDSFEVTGVSAEYVSSLTITNDGNGSATGPSVVIDGVATPILAVPNTNYQFAQWLGISGAMSFSSPTGASSNVTVTGGDATIEGTFKYLTYSLTITNDGHGSATGPSTVNSGVATPILAVPNANYSFAQWLGISGTSTFSNPTGASSNVTVVGGNATIEATFNHNTYLLTMANDGNGTTVPTTEIVWSATGINVLGVPNPGYSFNQWGVTGGVVLSGATGSFAVATLTGNATVTATFSNNTYTLTMANDGNGTTVPSGATGVLSHTPFNISAEPSADYVFSNWTVAGDAVVASPTSVVTTVQLIDSSDTVTAHFTFSQAREGPNFNTRDWDRSKPDFFQANPYAGQIAQIWDNPRDGERVAEERQYQE